MSAKDKHAYVRFKMDQCLYCVSSQKGWNDMVKTIFNEYEHDPNKVIMEIESGKLDQFKAKYNDGRDFEVDSFPQYAHFKNGIFMHSHYGAREGPELVKEVAKSLKLKKKDKKHKQNKSRKTRSKRKNRVI